MPRLTDWNPSTGPIDLNDWLALIEPIMADLTATSHDWWDRLLKEARQWYQDHMALSPMDRLTHEPQPSKDLDQPKWIRLERRASTLLMMSIPEAQKEELVSTKRITALKIICHLFTTFQPGGLAEKEVILRSLEMPQEAATVAEAVSSLRKWMRWRRRAMELQVSEPDPFLLLKGLGRIVRRPLEANRELNFRISLARSMLQVDSTPTKDTVGKFSTHLLAEMEQIAHLEGSKKSTSKDTQKQAQPEVKVRKIEEGGKGEGKSGKGERAPCKFFITTEGCRKGKGCRWAHNLDDQKRCWNCGSTQHYAPACDRPREPNKEGSPEKSGKPWEGKDMKPTAKVVKKEEATKKEEVAKEGSNEGDSSEAMKGLLEEANKMLKALQQGKNEEDEGKEVRLQKLQKQLDELKTLKVFRISKIHTKEGDYGLLDSGATHALRGRQPGESLKDLTEVRVTLACGRDATLKMTRGGTMIGQDEETEPIVPLGKMVSQLGCTVEWDEGGLVVVHPERGRLDTTQRGGCPHIPRPLALDIIQELEEKSGWMKKMKTKEEDEEEVWKKMVAVHPVFRDLPEEVKKELVVTPSKDLTALPGMNRRQRRKIQREGATLHLFAGEDDGFTLSQAVKSAGGDVQTLIELDQKRGPGHDLMSSDPYATLLRLAFDNRIRGILAGPNCRTRSVLRNYRMTPECHGPRPLREWGGEEFGRRDLRKDEKTKVWQDDVMLFRTLLLYVLAVHVEKTKDEEEKEEGIKRDAKTEEQKTGGEGWKKIILALEQPSAPEYLPKTVSFWWTDQWRKMKEMYDLQEIKFNQGDWKGEEGGKGCIKPTTIGGNVEIKVPEERNPEAKGRSQDRVQDSKSLSRWVPGLMKELAKEVVKKCQERPVQLKPMSWEQHVKHGHVPFRRDCKICQQSGAKSAPHRRLNAKKGQFPRAGVLSVDTTGPLVKGEDLMGNKMRFRLVGAYTWLAPKDSPLEDKRNERVPEEEVDAIEGLRIDDSEGEADDEAEHTEEDPQQDPPGNPEEPQGGERAINPQEPQEAAKEEVDQPEDFEIKIFRLVTPLPSKAGGVVLQAVIDMILKLRSDGFDVSQVHSDNGGEFTSDAMRRWMKARGYIRTFTGVSNPQSNGRAENAVQQVKTHIRRLLHQAGWSEDQWPLAARHCDEQLRMWRCGLKQKFPPLGAEVLVKKRRWNAQQFLPTMDRVTYIAPCWEGHGHWVKQEDGTTIVARFCIADVWNPVTDHSWLAVMTEMPDPLEERRRLRRKTPPELAKMEVQEDEPGEEGRDPEPRRRSRLLQLIMEEMTALMEDPSEEALKTTMQSVAKLRMMMETGTSEDVLQTRIVGLGEVMKDLEGWKKPIEEELKSLVEDKMALEAISKEEVEKMFREAHAEGRKLEVVPGKLVTVVKPAPEGGKKKARIVACGNFTAKDAQDELYASTGDAVTLRIMMKLASENQWDGVTLDIRTAFLNTPWEDMDVLVKPPHLLIRMKLVEEGTLWRPTKALYGFRKSPRLWGNHRDSTMRKMEVPHEGKRHRLTQLVSEPNLWRIDEVKDEDEEEEKPKGPPKALMMVYVDDLFATGPTQLLKALTETIKKEWNTSTPEWINEDPTRFLGMGISKTTGEDGLEVWAASQQDYVKELLRRNVGEDEKKWPKRKVPISKDPPAEHQEEPKVEGVRKAQKIVGEALWLVTRTRPDMMYALAKMASQVLHQPQWVAESASQLWGYMAATIHEGITFEKGPSWEGWEEQSGLAVYADASFAPSGKKVTVQ